MRALVMKNFLPHNGLFIKRRVGQREKRYVQSKLGPPPSISP
jgi:hypothetical protein